MWAFETEGSPSEVKDAITNNHAVRNEKLSPDGEIVRDVMLQAAREIAMKADADSSVYVSIKSKHRRDYDDIMLYTVEFSVKIKPRDQMMNPEVPTVKMDWPEHEKKAMEDEKKEQLEQTKKQIEHMDKQIADKHGKPADPAEEDKLKHAAEVKRFETKQHSDDKHADNKTKINGKK